MTGGGGLSAIGIFGPTNLSDPVWAFGGLTSSGLEVPQGDPGAISDAARALQTLSAALAAQGKSIGAAAQTAAKWQGQAASAYVAYSGHVSGVCSANAGATHDASAALQSFSTALAHVQAVTRQAIADFDTAAGQATQHHQTAATAGLAAETATLNAASAPHPAAQAAFQSQAARYRDDQAHAANAASMAQSTAEAAQRRGQQALDAYRQDAQSLTNRLHSATNQLRQAPPLPGSQAASHHGGGSLWGAVLPGLATIGLGVLDGLQFGLDPITDGATIATGAATAEAVAGGAAETAALDGTATATEGLLGAPALSETSTATEELLPGIDRGDGRDILGQFTGKGGYGADGEVKALDTFEARTGDTVIRTKVRATLPDGSTRYYDGLVRQPDGSYLGIEVKSGNASLSGSQRLFDAQVRAGTSATATVGGEPIQISSTQLLRP